MAEANQIFFRKAIQGFFEEDDLHRNFHYFSSLPTQKVNCQLKIKSDLTLAGLPFFVEGFNYLQPQALDSDFFKEYEGQDFKGDEKSELNFELPFNVALTGERIALNILTRLSSIATTTKMFKEKLNNNKIAILDTRKTTPGLRSLEKYAVTVGGGINHRMGQLDCFMIKDNHKQFFGGIKKSLEFFKSTQSFYTPVIVEIHDLKELVEAIECGVQHVMLDNFSKENIVKALSLKKSGMTYEISGGVTLENIQEYNIEGIDAISVGMLTSFPLKVDISLKYSK
ncbi:MAG: carboxylating nicotinate-nucleotide diphosphorylase [Halobacteriovoraceae bacterium]|nr:carboxylating nicotinate-nucleotide diphosphorylase [Halobacteriovoraceae bacterium]